MNVNHVKYIVLCLIGKRFIFMLLVTFLPIVRKLRESECMTIQYIFLFRFFNMVEDSS
jgi:hypothetical protein